jgi:hypothetical protein
MSLKKFTPTGPPLLLLLLLLPGTALPLLRSEERAAGLLLLLLLLLLFRLALEVGLSVAPLNAEGLGLALLGLLLPLSGGADSAAEKAEV